MHRILSAETAARATNSSSEFITKRLCCSFLFTVAFLALIGGFLLGRYATDRAILLRQRNLNLIEDDHPTVDDLSEILNFIFDQSESIPLKSDDQGLDEKLSKFFLTLESCNNYIVPDSIILESDVRTNVKNVATFHIEKLVHCFNNASLELAEYLKN